MKTAAGACAGAALALLLVTGVETWQVLVAVVVAAVLGTVLVKDKPVTVAQPVRQPPVPPKQVNQPPVPPKPANTGPPQLRVVLDAPPSGQWWTKTSPAAPRPNGESPRPPAQARDLTGYVETARVVQCPQCGSFHIDVTRLAGGYSFRCRAGEHAWQWQPGRAWPATVVVSRRRNS